VSGSTVILTWSAPAGGDAPTSYLLEAGSASGLANLANTDTGSPVPTLTATGVGAGTYFVRVRSRNSGGTSAPSNEVILTVGGGCAGAPGAPTSLSSTVNGSSVSLGWQAPSGACTPTSYLIEAGSGPGLSNLASVNTGSTVATFAATGVGAGTYFVRVRAVNGPAVGGASNEITLVVGTTPTPSARTWTLEGALLTDVTSGFPGQAIADVSAIRLNDGRWRLLFAAGGAMRSAISPDGLALTMEAGIRSSNPCGAPRALRLDDGRVRVFCSTPATGIQSYISSDEGLTLTLESPVLVPNAATGITFVFGEAVVRTSDGGWRMYFTEGGPPGPTTQNYGMFSATSRDLLTWTVEAGVRLGPGSAVAGTISHPSAIVNADGSVSVFYWKPGGAVGIYSATSADGVTFTSETLTGVSVGFDPDVVPLPGGGYRMYVNRGDDVGGTIYSARSPF